MPEVSTISMFGGLLLAGLAGSLHCIGMCGPILLGFSQAFRAGESDAANTQTRPRRLAGDFALYHAGRIWTYSLLGFIAGLVGQGVRQGSVLVGWHRGMAIAAAVVCVLVGLGLLGVLPGMRAHRSTGWSAALTTGCGFKRFGGKSWFQALVRHRGVTSRLLLGVIMGLLPCGLVYAMLAVVAVMPTPMHAAAGMMVFGIGTVPSLSAVLVTSHILPTHWRAHGTRLAALLVIASGLWMGGRALVSHDACQHCAGEQPAAAALGD